MNDELSSNAIRKVWRKTVYWAKRHDRARYGTTDRFQAINKGKLDGKVVVLGGGAFGTAMATHIGRKGYSVCMVLRDKLVRDFINKKHVNPRYLSEFDLPPSLTAATDAEEAFRGCSALVHCMPVQASRKALEAMRHLVPKGVPIAVFSKGLELGTRELMCDLVLEALGRDKSDNPVVVVSGPSFAKEIMDRRATSVVAASTDVQAAMQVA